MKKDAQTIKDAVRDAYARIAEGGGSCCGSGSSCCGTGGLSKKLGYASDELAALPVGADMGLSCGNPFAVDALKPGETVVDLGCGGGFDAFIAARKVGPQGRVIGVDMTPEMIAKARKNSAEYTRRTGWNNLEFRLGEIEHLPVADGTVDVILSNCVVNLSQNKAQVWREAARVLKPGGRIAVSDIALVRPLPEPVRASVIALAGCVAGAVTVDETKRMLAGAGFTKIVCTSHPENIDAMTNWSDPLYREIVAHIPAGMKISDFVTEVTIAAVKPKEHTA